jgi:hypothetical protein
MTNELRARILAMLNSLMETAEAMPIDVVGPDVGFTLEEMLALMRLEADFAAAFTEAMRLGDEIRARLDRELVDRDPPGWRMESPEEIAAREAAAVVLQFTTVTHS